MMDCKLEPPGEYREGWLKDKPPVNYPGNNTRLEVQALRLNSNLRAGTTT